MQRTRLSQLASLFSDTAFGGVIALVAALTGCGEDDGSTDTATSSRAGSAGRGETTTPNSTPPTSSPAASSPAASMPAASMPPAAPPAELPPGTVAVCERPESAHFDAGSSAWYVSCQAKNNVPDDGYVTKLSADATQIITEKFVSGLDEPKGIRINDGKLYVTDVSELVTADLATGEKLVTTTVVGIDPQVPERSSLNDVTADPASGDVYVSDNRNDILYRFDTNGESPELLIRGPVLEGPNGLVIDRRDAGAPRLLIATLGPGLNPMLGVTERLGAVIAIGLADLNDGDGEVETTYVSQRIGNLDGMELFGDDLLVSDFFAGRVMRLTPTLAAATSDEGAAQIIRQSLANSADLGIDVESGLLMVPETAKGTLVAIELEQ